jgi:hypothetical protein
MATKTSTTRSQLLEAHETLIEKGIYPINILLHEATETVAVAEAVEALEDLLESYQRQLPALHALVKLNGARLLENKAPEQTLVNYSFVCEALGKRVKEAVKLLEGKVPEEKTLLEAYGQDGQRLVEFCFKKAQTLSLLEGDYSPVISSAAKDLATIPFRDLKFICESVPAMRLYVSLETHKRLAREVVGLNESAVGDTLDKLSLTLTPEEFEERINREHEEAVKRFRADPTAENSRAVTDIAGAWVKHKMK